MERLNTVLPNGTFGMAVSSINTNFSLIVNAINSLEYSSTKSKGIRDYGFIPSTETLPNAVNGDWCMVLSEGNTFPATIWTFDGTTWSPGGTWNPEGIDLSSYAKTTEMTTAIAASLAQAIAQIGYAEVTVSGTTLSASLQNYVLPTSGGTIHLKMSAPGTGASTLNINNTGAKELWYNGAAVSDGNTWETNEIISVFYDGTRYMASNSQGGGKADSQLDENSTLPVQNKVVTQAINTISANLQDVEETLSVGLEKIDVLKDAHFRLHQDAAKRSNIVDININKEQMLLAMSRHINIPTSFTTSSKRLTLAWCSDVHSDLERWARFVDYCNYYKDILDAAIVTGDLNQTWDFDMGWEMLMDYAKEHLEIPIIPVIGNHDASGDKVSGHNALASGSVDWLGENYITPYIDEDCVQGEKDGVKQAYFYRDFAAPKIRVISINDYDMPRWAGYSHFLSPSENEDLSEAIPATNGMSLTAGNIYTWRGLYFKVAQTVSFGAARTFPRTNWYGGQYVFPFSHTGIWGRYISQAQADFLVDALNSVPSGYNVIIASHLLLDNTRGGVAADEKWHCRNANSNMGIAYCQNGYILQDILSAYMNKTTLSKSYAPQVENASAGGGASLASDWRYPTVTVEADFSSAQGSVICQLAGHLHEDVAIWSGRMTDAELLLIGAPSNCYHAWLENESNGAWQCGDIYKGENKPDIFNVISFDTTDKAIQLLRIGADMTDRMEERVSTRISYINN